VLAEPEGLSPAVDVDIADGTAVIKLYGDLDLPVRSALEERLAEVAAKKPDVLVYDLAAVTFLDCGTAAVLVRAARLLPSGKEPVLRSACPLVRRVLTLTRLDTQCELAAPVDPAGPGC
jgi:anti-anti-sigma factor